MKIIFGLLMVCCLAVGHAKQPMNKEVESYTLVDDIIRAILNNLKNQISSLKIPDIEESFTSDIINASFSAKEITHKNIDDFEIVNLHSNLIPLKISNLTLSWKNIKGSALYDFDVYAVFDRKDSLKFFGKGLASVSLDDLFFTIGAILEQKNGAFQIKKNGLFGFDVALRSSKVELGTLNGSEEVGQVVGQLISDMLPSIIAEFKHPLFNIMKNDIIEIINKILRTKKDILYDESNESEELRELENIL